MRPTFRKLCSSRCAIQAPLLQPTRETSDIMRSAVFLVLMGMYAVNVWATAPTSTDPRVVWWLDPRVPWAGIKQIASYNTAKPDKSVQTIPEPGLKGSGQRLHAIARR